MPVGVSQPTLRIDNDCRRTQWNDLCHGENGSQQSESASYNPSTMCGYDAGGPVVR